MTWVDGHAHFHPAFSLETFLQSASDNVHRGNADVGVLLLAHIGSEQPLKRLQETNVPNDWQRSQPDATSLLFQRNGISIVIIAGRQTVTSEKLELLTLCTNEPIEEGLSLHDSIEMAISLSAIPVVPWGFGKWWFSRGKVLQDLIRSNFEGRWLIGDSGCRIAGLTPKLLATANAAGIATLAGSDPLPMKSHETRAASYGTVLTDAIDLNQPTAWMCNALRNLGSAPMFGRCRSVPQFIRDQLSLRLAQRSKSE